MIDLQLESRVRTAAMDWLASQREQFGEVIPRDVLAQGFAFMGEQIHLMGPSGIFKPRILSVPISMTTTTHGPYNDSFGPDGLLRYSYRGTDPRHRDNRGLSRAMTHRIPMLYFYAVVPGRYVAVAPVFVVADHPDDLSVSVAVDDETHTRARQPAAEGFEGREDGDSERRRYVTALTKRRLHQHSFRERVLAAYRNQCALCRLRHAELLEAAHIVEDSEPGGEPTVRNGLSLCHLHHAVFDEYFIGIRPDYTIEVRSDIRTEKDGPTLLHGIQSLHGMTLDFPSRVRDRPDPLLLEVRFEKYLARSAGAAPGGV